MTLQEGASKGLLDVKASLKDDDPPSKSLFTALGSETEKGTTTTDDAFKLPDLVTPEVTKEGEVELQQEKELLKPLQQPVIKPRVYTHGHFDKSKIKLGVAIQHKQQKQKAERWLEQDIELEKTTEELENIARKEEARLRRVERYKCRTKEKEEKEGEEDTLEDLVVESTSKSTVDIARENPEKTKLAKAKNPQGKKTKPEIEVVQEAEEEEDNEEIDETMTKRKIVGCINKEEVAAFQEYV